MANRRFGILRIMAGLEWPGAVEVIGAPRPGGDGDSDGDPSDAAGMIVFSTKTKDVMDLADIEERLGQIGLSADGIGERGGG